MKLKWESSITKDDLHMLYKDLKIKIIPANNLFDLLVKTIKYTIMYIITSIVVAAAIMLSPIVFLVYILASVKITYSQTKREGEEGE